MAAVSISLDRDLEARVSRYADGIGVPLEDLCERALKYALSSRYPDNSLPSGGRPDNALPGQQPGIDNSLPRPPFDGTIDNELPDGEIPPEIDNTLPGYGRPDNALPDVNLNPNPDVDVDKDAPRPGHGLPEGGAQPKK